jgi:hypothetical protein
VSFLAIDGRMRLVGRCGMLLMCGVLLACISGMSGVFGRYLVRRGLVAAMVFVRVVFVCVLFRSLPQGLRNIDCRFRRVCVGGLSGRFGMRMVMMGLVIMMIVAGRMFMIVVMIGVIMTRVFVVVGVTVMMLGLVVVLVMMALLGVSLSGRSVGRQSLGGGIRGFDDLALNPLAVAAPA